VPFVKVGEQTVHEGHVIRLAIGQFTDPDGGAFERELVHHPGAVSVVPLLDDGRVVLVRQYRASIDGDLLEIPAGKRDVPDEPAEITAGRELEEEVGYRAGSLELLGSFYNSPGFSDELSYTYLARDLEHVGSSTVGPEEAHMTIEHVPLDDVPDLIRRGALVDAKSIIGLLLARELLDRDSRGR
jgi:ADP-ribose pyrophosphatase